MKNNKGFVSSALLYSLLILFLALILGLLALLSNRKMILDRVKDDIKGEVNEMVSHKTYKTYANGTAIYYNPKTGKLCSNYIAANSTTGVKEGCLKWYIFNDSESRKNVTMILDHNTSGNVAWNSSGNNADGMNEVATRLSEDTTGWVGSPRLITANEVAHITGADSNDTIKWAQSKTYNNSSTNTSEEVTWFYLDGGSNSNPTVYASGSNGWQKRVANATTPSNYAWLYDYTYGCDTYGCTTKDDNKYPYGTKDSTNTENIYGYWTSDAVVGNSYYAWRVSRNGSLIGNDGVDFAYSSGVRPVITVEKSLLEEPTTFVYSYTGNSQSFVAPITGKYKVELWGAQGGTITGTNKAGYTKGEINLQKGEILYVYVGQKGDNTSNIIFNGGGLGGPTNSSDTSRKGQSGGGATDIRYFSSTPTQGDLIWDSNIGLASRIMVAAGAGGGTNSTYETKGDYSIAGGLIGGSGGYYQGHTYVNQNGKGATQLQGGAAGVNHFEATGTNESGSFGKGGSSNSASDSIGSGGGGGDYYGGGSGGATLSSGCGQGGGGGSSFISGHLGCRAITSATDLTPKSQTDANYGLTENVLANSYHYSNKKFNNTEMRSGNETMPTQNGLSTMTGNTGNGYAKITYCGDSDSTCSDIKYLVNYSDIDADLIGDFTIKTNGKNSTYFYSVTATEDSGLIKKPTGDANRVAASFSDSLITITSKKAVDLTDYSKLVFVLRLTTNLSDNTLTNTTYAGLSNSIEDSATTTFFRSDNVSTTFNQQVSKVIEIDVSDINTSKYIKVATHHSNNVTYYTAYTFVDKIYLVK